MLRPKRNATQKQKLEQKDTDDGLDLSEDSDGDFSSASSDEWDPAKKKGMEEETFEESESEQEGSSAESEVEDEEPESFMNSIVNKT